LIQHNIYHKSSHSILMISYNIFTQIMRRDLDELVARPLYN